MYQSSMVQIKPYETLQVRTLRQAVQALTSGVGVEEKLSTKHYRPDAYFSVLHDNILSDIIDEEWHRMLLFLSGN